MRALLLGLLAGCTVGSVGSIGQEPDAAASPDGGVDAPSVGPDGAVGFTCRDKQPLSAVGDGHHHPGENCLNACHNHGFTLAGTMTTTTTATTPYVGASITVKDASAHTFDMVTQANGNFYTSQPVTFPVTVTASACPSIHAMSGTVTAGGCNQTGCHAAAGGAGHIALP